MFTSMDGSTAAEGAGLLGALIGLYLAGAEGNWYMAILSVYLIAAVVRMNQLRKRLDTTQSPDS